MLFQKNLIEPLITIIDIMFFVLWILCFFLRHMNILYISCSKTSKKGISFTTCYISCHSSFNKSFSNTFKNTINTSSK